MDANERGTRFDGRQKLGMLLPEHDALNALCPSGGSVALDQRRAHLRIALGRLELPGHSSEEAVENQLFLDSDH